MQPSHDQKDILNWLTLGQGNACCKAVAGSGKSTTLKMAALRLIEDGLTPADIKIIVFGKANSVDLLGKFGEEWRNSISTLHSVGWSLLKQHGKFKHRPDLINRFKYRSIAVEQGLIGQFGRPGTLKELGVFDKESDFTKILDLMRLTNLPATQATIESLVQHFELAPVWKPDLAAEAIKLVLDIGEKMAVEGECFDFNDQIWLPVKWQLAPQTHYKFLLVDECQDLNPAQLRLSLQLAGQGRILMVGDPNQSIMGFAGADHRSYATIVNRIQAKELPLSTCYRCPVSHLKLVRLLYPHINIQPTATAVKGTVSRMNEVELETVLKPGDLVLSRKTEPLVTLCIQLVGLGLVATVRGKDIGESLKHDLGAISQMPNFTYATFLDCLGTYQAQMNARYSELKNGDQQKSSLKDRLDALRAIYKAQSTAQRVSELEAYITTLFSDDSSSITLSTCHKAKGLEAERVFLLRPEDMPLVWKGQLLWQLEQEHNLIYVALTRSKQALFIVGDPEWLR